MSKHDDATSPFPCMAASISGKYADSPEYLGIWRHQSALLALSQRTLGLTSQRTWLLFSPSLLSVFLLYVFLTRLLVYSVTNSFLGWPSSLRHRLSHNQIPWQRWSRRTLQPLHLYWHSHEHYCMRRRSGPHDRVEVIEERSGESLYAACHLVARHNWRCGHQHLLCRLSSLRVQRHRFYKAYLVCIHYVTKIYSHCWCVVFLLRSHGIRLTAIGLALLIAGIGAGFGAAHETVEKSD